MSASLILEITKYIYTVPGILGLTSMDFDKKPIKLSENDISKSVLIIKDEKDETNIKISIAIIVSSEIQSKTIVSEAKKIIQTILVKYELKASSILIYIRGVK